MRIVEFRNFIIEPLPSKTPTPFHPVTVLLSFRFPPLYYCPMLHIAIYQVAITIIEVLINVSSI